MRLSITLLVAISSCVFADESITGKQVVNHYSDLAFHVYKDAHTTARSLDTAIDNLLLSPSSSTLEAAKNAWIIARVPYQQSEVFRFGNPIVDDWEGQLNAWPLDEGLIDYVHTSYQHELGNAGATANIISKQAIQIGNKSIDVRRITPKLLASLNELAGSEANVATGYHAIEFLLWGQDLNGTEAGAGERPYTDFVLGKECTNQYCERRREYLKAASTLLVSDLVWMRNQWEKGDKNNYRSRLLSEPSEQGLRRMLFGMGSLSLGELAGERMKVALEAQSPEDEHDCFSDNTHNSHFYNELGIYNVFTGSYTMVNGEEITGPSLYSLIKQHNPKDANSILTTFKETKQTVYQLVESAEKQKTHFDQLIAPRNADGNQMINKVIASLVTQTQSIEKIATILGISNLNPDNADHEFVNNQ